MTQKEYLKMSSEALGKTAIKGNWQSFSKKLFQHFIHHKKALKVTKFQFKIICRSKVLDKNIPLWYIVLLYIIVIVRAFHVFPCVINTKI